jgi:hypothetical protein
LDCGYSICKGRGGVGWGGKDDSVGWVIEVVVVVVGWKLL